MTFTTNSLLPWFVLLLPLGSAGVITLLTRRRKNVSSYISVAAVLGSFFCSCAIFTKLDISAPEFTWIDIRGVLNVPIGFVLDDLSRLMLLVVSGVGSLIHIYSLGYMRDDEGKSRYFAALSLFMFAMLGIVLANNFVMMFIFWELVGFTSYVLIGHWFERDSAAEAAKKAFLTALLGALLATQQSDIKKILAYSTISQLGYMIMAVGLASDEAAMFHLFTHAFFKALLFLAAGSIIVSLHHEQNIWKMGGLAGKLKITFATFAVGGLALIGCPPFSGFFSKDAILALAYGRNMPIFIIGLTTAFLTAFYISRAVTVVFFGKPRSDVARKGTESPLVMIVPLVILAFFALVAGLEPVAKYFLIVPHEGESGVIVAALALSALALGVGIATWLYRNREQDPLHVDLIRHRFYIDEFYEWLIDRTQELLARIANFVDRWIIDAGVVRGASGGTFGIGSLLRLVQVGNLQAYAFLFGLGIVVLIYFPLFR